MQRNNFKDRHTVLNVTPFLLPSFQHNSMAFEKLQNNFPILHLFSNPTRDESRKFLQWSCTIIVVFMCMYWYILTWLTHLIDCIGSSTCQSCSHSTSRKHQWIKHARGHSITSHSSYYYQSCLNQTSIEWIKPISCKSMTYTCIYFNTFIRY